MTMYVLSVRFVYSHSVQETKPRADQWEQCYAEYVNDFIAAAKSCCTPSACRVRKIHDYRVKGSHKMVNNELICNLTEGTQGACFERPILYKYGTATQYHQKVRERFSQNMWKKYRLDVYETERDCLIRLGIGHAHKVQDRNTMGPADFGYRTFKRLMYKYLPEVVKHTPRTCLCHYCMDANYLLTGLGKCLKKAHCAHTCHEERQAYGEKQGQISEKCVTCNSDRAMDAQNNENMPSKHKHVCDCPEKCCADGACDLWSTPEERMRGGVIY